MAEEATNVTEVKTTSDGFVKIALEKYNEMTERLATQKNTIKSLSERLDQARAPVINRTIVEKTAEMAARDNRVWGATLLGLGGSMFVVGGFLYKAGLSEK